MLPTVLDLLGISLPADQLYQGESVYSVDAGTNRTIYLNTFRQYGVIRSGLFFCGDRSQGRGPDRTRGVFSFSNEGARTIFQLVDEQTPAVTNSAGFSISSFDQFQGNFLRHYPDYCRLMRPQAQAQQAAQ
jgi:hypothetical protein